MKKIDLDKMGMNPLSITETKEIDGGSFWKSLKNACAIMEISVNFLMVEPLKAFGNAVARGIEAGIK